MSCVAYRTLEYSSSGPELPLKLVYGTTAAPGEPSWGIVRSLPLRHSDGLAHLIRDYTSSKRWRSSQHDDRSTSILAGLCQIDGRRYDMQSLPSNLRSVVLALPLDEASMRANPRTAHLCEHLRKWSSNWTPGHDATWKSWPEPKGFSRYQAGQLVHDQLKHTSSSRLNLQEVLSIPVLFTYDGKENDRWFSVSYDRKMGVVLETLETYSSLIMLFLRCKTNGYRHKHGLDTHCTTPDGNSHGGLKHIPTRQRLTAPLIAHSEFKLKLRAVDRQIYDKHAKVDLGPPALQLAFSAPRHSIERLEFEIETNLIIWSLGSVGGRCREDCNSRGSYGNKSRWALNELMISRCGVGMIYMTLSRAGVGFDGPWIYSKLFLAPQNGLGFPSMT
ncbi:hypothetical protein BC629DRAFT_1660891 [Irpex lacteus]|nr:hypothetical protein BC629DRAFT_1660891 [Irpex lacteus]